MVSKKPYQGKQGGRPEDSLEGFDASPDSGNKNGRKNGSRSPRNIQETRVWKDSVGGLSSMWKQYVAILKQSFARLPRDKQEFYIIRLSQAVTIGSSILAISFFYPFLPTIIRVFALPLVIVVSWWCGTKIVAPQMVIRMSSYLNKE